MVFQGVFVFCYTDGVMKILFLFVLVGAMAFAGFLSLDNLENFARVEVVQAPPQTANILIEKEDEASTTLEEAFEEVENEILTEVKEEPEPVIEEKVVEEVKEDELVVMVNTFNLYQGDVLLVTINSEKKASVTFDGKKLAVFSQDGKQFAFYGADAKHVPGLYELVVKVGVEEDVKKIAVKDAKFPVTKIVVTPKLEEQGFTPENIVQSFEKNENVQIREAVEVSNVAPYFSESFRVPLDKKVIVGNFGNIRQSGESSFQHLGIDLDAKVGDPLYAMNDGKIIFQKTLPSYGNTIIIDHGVGIFSLYLHLDQFLKSLGDEVSRGDLIGRTGDTGYSIDPHLHLSLKINGASVNPLEFIESSKGLE